MHRETVFIVDDDPSVRDALSLLLSLKGYVAATFASAEDFLSAMRPDWRGCVLADIRMPGMSGLEMQSRLLDRAPGLRVVVMTAHGDVAAARQAFLAKAVDFIEKPFDGEQLIRSIEQAFVQPAALGTSPAQGSQRLPHEVLSAREQEVMSLMVQGMHNRKIGEELGISPRTVEVHKARVMEKLQVRSLVDLVRLVDHHSI